VLSTREISAPFSRRICPALLARLSAVLLIYESDLVSFSSKFRVFASKNVKIIELVL
jgi:hypothetical protein